MTRARPYQNQGNIYQIARKLQDRSGLLLTPNRAIFSALCSVLSLDDEQTKRRILRDEPFDFSQKAIRRFDERDLEYFVDVWPEAKGIVRRDGMPFQEWEKEEQVNYVDEKISSSCHTNNLAVRLASAKTRREHFPTTVFFEKDQYKRVNNHRLHYGC